MLEPHIFTYKSNHETEWPEDSCSSALLEIIRVAIGVFIHASDDWNK